MTFCIAGMFPFAIPSFVSSASADLVPASRVAERMVDPLCTPALWNNPFAEGIASIVDVFAPPPDWPKIMTLDGSPPNFSMLSRTHSSEATRSIIPTTPAYSNSDGAPRSAR